MRISVLASGSGGNAVYVATSSTALLVEAGLAPREIPRRVARVPGGSVSSRLPAKPHAVVVTHEHGDHGRHAASYAKLGVPVLATAGTARALGVDARELAAGGAVAIGDVQVLAVRNPHDAVEPVGIRIESAGASVGVLLDCGTDDASIARAFAGVDVLVIEANHDEMMLKAGPYPWSLKKRIMSDVGHLSNVQTASLVRQVNALARPPSTIVLAHLSKTNNRPTAAKAAVTPALAKGQRLVLSEQGAPTAWIDARSRKAPIVGAQLALEL